MKRAMTVCLVLLALAGCSSDSGGDAGGSAAPLPPCEEAGPTEGELTPIGLVAGIPCVDGSTRTTLTAGYYECDNGGTLVYDDTGWGLVGEPWAVTGEPTPPADELALCLGP